MRMTTRNYVPRVQNEQWILLPWGFQPWAPAPRWLLSLLAYLLRSWCDIDGWRGKNCLLANAKAVRCVGLCCVELCLSRKDDDGLLTAAAIRRAWWVLSCGIASNDECAMSRRMLSTYAGHFGWMTDEKTIRPECECFQKCYHSSTRNPAFALGTEQLCWDHNLDIMMENECHECSILL
jgi:hypothetical protein